MTVHEITGMPEGVDEALLAWVRGPKAQFTKGTPVADGTVVINQTLHQVATIYRYVLCPLSLSLSQAVFERRTCVECGGERSLCAASSLTRSLTSLSYLATPLLPRSREAAHCSQPPRPPRWRSCRGCSLRAQPLFCRLVAAPHPTAASGLRESRVEGALSPEGVVAQEPGR